MLDANLSQQLKAYLEKVVTPVTLVAYLDDSPKSVEMRKLLEQIAELSDKVSFREADATDGQRVPAFDVKRTGEPLHLQFAGIPMGHEFTSLVLALLQAGGHPSKLDAETISQIHQLDEDCYFESYISLSCQNCPDVVQALNLLAILNPRIKHVMIDGALFQDEVDQRQVMSVPSVYLNGQPFGQGRMTVKDILAKLDKNNDARQAAKLKDKKPFDMLIVGGGPAGAAGAIYSARKGIRTGLVTERFGGQVMDTLGIENFISVPYTEGPKLAAAMEQQVLSYDVDIMDHQRVEKLIPGDLIELQLANGASLKSRSILLAPGASWREMNVPGEKEYRGKGVAYCPHCDGPLFKGKRVAVIGGGNSGVEAAIDLAGIVSHVTVLEFDNKLRADAVLQKKLHSLPNVEVFTSAQTTEVRGDGNKVVGLTYKNRQDDTVHQIDLEGIFVQIGLVPNTAWLKGSVELSKFGEIVVDDRGQTSVPGVFAAGDATTVPFKQIVISMGDGAKASLAAFDYLIRSPIKAEQHDTEEAVAS